MELWLLANGQVASRLLYRWVSEKSVLPFKIGLWIGIAI